MSAELSILIENLQLTGIVKFISRRAEGVDYIIKYNNEFYTLGYNNYNEVIFIMLPNNEVVKFENKKSRSFMDLFL